jgi:hypothetical protein
LNEDENKGIHHLESIIKLDQEIEIMQKSLEEDDLKKILVPIKQQESISHYLEATLETVPRIIDVTMQYPT